MCYAAFEGRCGYGVMGWGVEGEEGGGGWWGWVGWSGQEKVKIRDSNPQALDPCSLAARRPNRSPQFSSARFGSVRFTVKFGSVRFTSSNYPHLFCC